MYAPYMHVCPPFPRRFEKSKTEWIPLGAEIHTERDASDVEYVTLLEVDRGSAC